MSNPNNNKKGTFLRVPGILAYAFLLFVTLFATFWGTAEFFHEGWFAPYTTFIFYMMPFLILMALTLIATFFPRTGGILIMAGGIAFTLWRISMLLTWHHDIGLSVWMTGFVIALPGILFFLDSVFRKKYGYKKPIKFTFKAYWKQSLVVFLPILLILGMGTPMLINNLSRIPLENYNETTIEGNDVTLAFAGDGPGWLYSNKHPIVFKDKKYVGMCWNEIALFGMDPIGFVGKKYGPSYDGTKESIYYATQEDFDKYNMFRYINYEGNELTETIQDYWRLPTIEEYVRLLKHRKENAGGQFDQATGQAHYEREPDKDGPVWAPDMEVIYYWTSTSFGESSAYDITYSGRTRYILKTTRQDYRGYRAVRTKVVAPLH